MVHNLLNAYFDESGSEQEDKLIVLAGYVHRAETWAEFSDDWRAILDEKPSIAYFHMVEAESLRDEFKDWDPIARDLKVDALAEVISKHQPWSIECRLSRNDYNQIVRPVAPYDLRSPYFPCFYGVIINLARLHYSMGLTLPTDFVFDDQGNIGAEAVLWYEFIKSIQEPKLQELLGSAPVFRDDKKVLPLQAADMLAWHIRRRREARNAAESRPVMDNLIPVSHSETLLGRRVLQVLAEQMSVVPNVELTRGKQGSMKYLTRQRTTR